MIALAKSWQSHTLGNQKFHLSNIFLSSCGKHCHQHPQPVPYLGFKGIWVLRKLWEAVWSTLPAATCRCCSYLCSSRRQAQKKNIGVCMAPPIRACTSEKMTDTSGNTELTYFPEKEAQPLGRSLLFLRNNTYLMVGKSWGRGSVWPWKTGGAFRSCRSTASVMCNVKKAWWVSATSTVDITTWHLAP